MTVATSPPPGCDHAAARIVDSTITQTSVVSRPSDSEGCGVGGDDTLAEEFDPARPDVTR
jgi:hypothetical protein